MKTDATDWMDWLHKMRAERERRRRENGISEADELKASLERGRRIMAEVHSRERPSVARDREADDED